MKKNKNVLSFFREVAIVVIGVLIAVSIGNYKENVSNQDYVEKTLLTIQNEIEISQKDVDTVLNKHYKLLEVLENEIENDSVSLAEILQKAGGLKVASVKNISLRFFINNKANLIDFELISHLQDIEFTASIMQQQIDRLSNHLYNEFDSKTKKDKIKTAFLLSDIINTEETLIEQFKDFSNKNFHP